MGSDAPARRRWLGGAVAAAGAVALVSGLAMAQDERGPRVHRPQPILEITPAQNAELRALETAARRAPPPRVEAALGPSFEMEARLEGLIDTHVRVSVAVTPDEVARMIGVREAVSAEEISSGLIYKGRLYAIYPLDDPGLELALIPRIGEAVVLKLARRPDETAFVVGWRSP